MGLFIHYSGTIKDNSLILQLTEEVQDVCAILNWHWHITDEQHIKGISFTPPECETLCLTFSENGELVSGIKLLYNIHPATTLSVKTQYAGMDIHITVIKLLKHLSQRYFAVFELSDEGGYWENGDEIVLRKQFNRYNGWLTAVQAALTNCKSEAGDTPASLADRLEQFLKEHWENNWEDYQ